MGARWAGDFYRSTGLDQRRDKRLDAQCAPYIAAIESLFMPVWQDINREKGWWAFAYPSVDHSYI